MVLRLRLEKGEVTFMTKRNDTMESFETQCQRSRSNLERARIEEGGYSVWLLIEEAMSFLENGVKHRHNEHFAEAYVRLAEALKKTKSVR